MKKIILIIIFISLSISAFSQDKKLVFTIESFTELAEKSYDDQAQFEVNYKLDNYSYGTLLNFKFGVEVFDDRDNKYSVTFDQVDVLEYIIQFGSPSYYPSIKVGESYRGSFKVKGNIKYVQKFNITKFHNKDLNMRNLPEEVVISDIIEWNTLIEGIEINSLF